VPNRSGCYVLTTFERAVLYVGLATDLRTRFSQHLDDPKKTGLTDMGRAVLFHWFETKEIQKVERTWLNIHYQFEGKRPILNSIDSPINA
jgi:predicted GIY-YIG superfamily endonuclease